MKVKVTYLGYIRTLVGKGEETFELKEKATLEELLTIIAEKYGRPFQEEVYESNHSKLKHGYGVIINGFLMTRLHGLKTFLKEGDKVFLTTLISGG